MLPGFGLYAGIFLGLIAMILMFLELGSRPIRMGLPVNLARSVPDLAGGAIVVRVEFAGYGKIQLFVNGKQVTQQQLPNALLDELKIRGEWVIYVQGDDRIAWRDVIDVVDVAKGLHARVVLITERGQPTVTTPRNRATGTVTQKK